MKEIYDYLLDKDIAVVGNAASILNNKKNIDKHEVVIRFNFGYPRERTYQYTGKRTDVWVFGGGDKIYSPFNEKLKLKYNPKYTIGIQKDNFFFINGVKPFPYNKIIPQLTDKLIELGGKNPSTGICFLEFIFNVIKYKKITIYGFDFMKTTDWSFPPAVDSRITRHENFIVEERLIKSYVAALDNVTLKED